MHLILSYIVAAWPLWLVLAAAMVVLNLEKNGN